MTPLILFSRRMIDTDKNVEGSGAVRLPRPLVIGISRQTGA
jgi:hypothetical protein